MKATWIGGGVVAVALVVLALFYAFRGGDAPDVALVPAVVAPEAGEIIVEKTEVIPDPEMVVEETEEVAPAPVDEAAAAPNAVEAVPVVPVARVSTATFDIVRVEPDGETVLAGRAGSNSVLAFLLDGIEVGTAAADNGGSFVALLSLGASEVPRVLTLLETFTDGTQAFAGQSVILAPSPKVLLAEVTGEDVAPVEGALVENVVVDVVEDVADDVVVNEAVNEEVAETPVADAAQEAVTEVADAVEAVTEAVTETENVTETVTEAVTEPATEAVGEVAVVVAPQVPQVPVDAPVVAAAPLEEAVAAAPTILLADSEGVRVLQSGGAGPQIIDNVSIDAINYDSAGEVALTGRSSGQRTVRIYLDNQPILDTEIAADGQWRADLPEIDTGTYTLRVDELNAEGDVVSRAETPFRREPVAAIQALDAGAGTQRAPVALITVQPGNTLWGIARDTYGEGLLYVRVFEANAGRIRNPDLIYPGQIFTVPD